MASNPETELKPETEPSPKTEPSPRTLHVWTKPTEHEDGPQSPTGPAQDGAGAAARLTLSDAVATIKKEDFANVASTPCAREGFLTGITAGTGMGAMKFVLQGNATKAANWAVGFFVLGSVASYEYCQYLRRAERLQMKRHIEIVAENRRQQARKAAEEKREQLKLEEDRNAARRPWYRFW